MVGKNKEEPSTPPKIREERKRTVDDGAKPREEKRIPISRETVMKLNLLKNLKMENQLQQ